VNIQYFEHEIFDPRFFSSNYTSYMPIHGLKPNMASNSPRNSRKSFEIIGFRGFNVTAEDDSTVSMTSRNPYKTSTS
jgi:hypothetical protein